VNRFEKKTIGAAKRKMDISVPSSSSAEQPSDDELQWRFSQIKGNIETDDAPTDGLFKALKLKLYDMTLLNTFYCELIFTYTE
jgi:hypothetical protein